MTDSAVKNEIYRIIGWRNTFLEADTEFWVKPVGRRLKLLQNTNRHEYEDIAPPTKEEQPPPFEEWEPLGKQPWLQVGKKEIE